LDVGRPTAVYKLSVPLKKQTWRCGRKKKIRLFPAGKKFPFVRMILYIYALCYNIWMKKKSFIFLIVCIILVSAFGVFAIGIAGHIENGACPIAMGSDCSYMNNAFSMAMHHISGIQSFTEAVIASGISIASIILSAIAVSWFIKLADSISNLFLRFQYIYLKRVAHPIFRHILKWIALRNKLDIYFYARAGGDFIS
jgi:hypothetical protein